MDLLSINVLTLELRESGQQKSLNDEFEDDQSDEDTLDSILDKKTLVNKRKRSRRKINVADNSVKERSGQHLDIITLDELAWHDSADDCWVAIYDYIYDCTEFVKSHPGGQDVLLEYAGRDATIAFIGTGHSNEARKILEKYLIGELPTNERIFRTIDGVKLVQNDQ